MARKAFLATTLLARVQAALAIAQKRALLRRAEVLDGPAMPLSCLDGATVERAHWLPRLHEVQITFEGTVRGEGAALQLIPGRPLFARLMPWRIRQIAVCCDVAEDEVPRLYIDGLAVDPTGTRPQP